MSESLSLSTAVVLVLSYADTNVGCMHTVEVQCDAHLPRFIGQYHSTSRSGRQSPDLQCIAVAGRMQGDVPDQ